VVKEPNEHEVERQSWPVVEKQNRPVVKRQNWIVVEELNRFSFKSGAGPR
jgi:hypothetical protein